MYGLVLEGGGAKGAYQIGAYMAIVEEGLEVKGVSGTSIGAINGAMIVQGDYERCYEIWNNIEDAMIFEDNSNEVNKLVDENIDLADLRILLNSFKHVVSNRGVNITPFKNLLEELIDEEKIRNSPMDYGLVTINLSDFKPVEVFKEDIPQNELRDYILASAYLPIFKQEKIGGKRYLDGGFYDNLPFRLLQTKGYEKFILIRTHARGLTRKVDLEDAIVVSPTEDLGGMHQYEQGKEKIKLGYYDCIKELRGLRGFKYYLNPKEEDFYFKQLASLSSEQLMEIRELIKAPDGEDRRLLFEYIIPKLGTMLGLDKNFTYEEILISLLERRAERVEVDRFKIYDYDELKDAVKCKPYNKNEVDSRPLISIFNRDKTILKLADIIFCKD